MTVIDYRQYQSKHGGQLLDLGGWLHNGNIFNTVGWSSRLNCTAAEYAARLDQEKQTVEASTPKRHQEPELIPPNVVSLGMNKIDAVKTLLREFIELRYNIITGKTEYRLKSSGGDYQEFTDRHFNSIRSRITEGYIKNLSEADLRMVIESDFTPDFCPIQEYFKTLPAWDGFDYMTQLADLVTVTPGQFGDTDDGHQIDARDVWRLYLMRWLIASVATMLGKYENHTCLTLLGEQGLGKTTYLRRLGIDDNLTFVGAFNPADKDSRLLIAEKTVIVLDELEATTKHDLAGIKSNMTLKSIDVRRPYGRRAERLPRRASFAASANDEHILSDISGSRRWLCVRVDSVNYKDVTPELMRGAYSQALQMLNDGRQYWFEGDEIQSLDKRNARFYAACAEEEALFKIIYHPREVYPISTISEILTNTELIGKMSVMLPGIRFSPKKLGQVLSKHGFARKCRVADHLQGYEVIPKRT